MAKWLKVQISGFAGVGKTTVAVIIEEALKQHGFNVEVFQNTDEDAEAKRRWLANGSLQEMVCPLLCETQVTIEEVQLRSKL